MYATYVLIAINNSLILVLIGKELLSELQEFFGDGVYVSSHMSTKPLDLVMWQD